MISPPRASRRTRLFALSLPLAGLAAVAAVAPAEARDEPWLRAAAQTEPLREAGFEVDVRIEGVVARIHTRQTVVNTAKHDHEMIYTFDVPADAAVTDVRVGLAGGGGTTRVVVDSASAISPMRDPDGVDGAADAAVLRLLARDRPGAFGPGLATYELRAWPVPAGKSIVVTTTWLAPLDFDEGRLRLRIPQRDHDAALVRERVEVSIKPPAGARSLGPLHGGGQLLARNAKAGATYAFDAPVRGDIVIEAMPDLGRRGALVSFATVPFGKQRGAVAVSVLSPLPRGSTPIAFERLLVVVDVSRSLGAQGRAAAADLADSLLAGSPAGTRVEAVLFDRTARRLFGAFEPNDGNARKKLDAAIRGAAGDNGSDLGAALDLAGTVVSSEDLGLDPEEGFERGARAPTLVAVISDGMFPLALTGERAIDRFGRSVIEEVEILGVTLVPDEAPLPDTDDGVFGELAARSHGRNIALRFGEAAARAKTLSAEIDQPLPFGDVALDPGGADLDLPPLPRAFAPGDGAVVLGFYHGAPPKKLAVTALQNRKEIRFAARRDAALGRAVAPLVLASAERESFVPRSQLAGDGYVAGTTLADGRRALAAAARSHPVVTQWTSLVALDARDRFARDRLEMARKWGTGVFTRLSPPPERDGQYGFEPYFDRDAEAEENGFAVTGRRTGELDRAIIQRVFDRDIVPRAQRCYEKALRKTRGLAGSLVVVIEVARGEVQHAAVERSTFPGRSVEGCVEGAAYRARIPRVALGDDVESIGVARYPLAFRRKKGDGGGRVEPGDGADQTIDLDTPLGGLPDEE